MSLYFWIICLTVAGPLLMSFDKKVAFYKSFYALFPAIVAVGSAFILWDFYFTERGIWGFTPEHVQGIYIYNLPLEECLFFVVVPFACLFIHEVLKTNFPEYKGQRFSRAFSRIMIISSLALVAWNWGRWYSVSAGSIAFLLALIFHKAVWFRNFALTYVVTLLPFLIVNGILTGAVTEKPVVWYNEMNINGFRIYTIPLEDLYYNFDLLLLLTAIFEHLKRPKSGI